jgi:hypothetical protein
MAARGGDYQANTNPYNDGAVVFYPDPNKWDSLHNAIANIGVQKRARESALAKYNDDLVKNINTAGVHTKDQPQIADKITELIEYGKKNPNDKLGVEQRYRDILFTVDNSKKDVANLKRISDAGKSGAMLLGSDMEQMNALSLPVGDPRRYNQHDEDIAGDIDNMSIFTKPFTPQQDKAFTEALISKNKPDEIPDYSKKIVDGPTGKILVPYESKYSDEKLKQIGDDAGELFNSNRGIQINYERAMDDADPEYLKQHNDIFQKVYHRDIVSHKDLAIADKMLGAVNSLGKKYRAYTDEDAKQERALQLIAARGRQTRKNQDHAASVGLDIEYPTDTITKEVGVTLDIKDKNTDKVDKKTVIFAEDVDPDRLNVVTGRDVSKGTPGVKPVPIFDKRAGKDRLGFYVDPGTGDWIGKDGQKISREAAKDRYVNKFAGTKQKALVNTKAEEVNKGKAPAPATPVKKGKYD